MSFGGDCPLVMRGDSLGKRSLTRSSGCARRERRHTPPRATLANPPHAPRLCMNACIGAPDVTTSVDQHLARKWVA